MLEEKRKKLGEATEIICQGRVRSINTIEERVELRLV
jgi:hypothetical protein